ncbi:ZIP family metal transporter [Myxococcota bacterium]
MMFLISSIVALAVGPAAYRLVVISKSRVAKIALEVLIVVAIAGIVLANILPHSLETAGWPAVVLLVLGILGPTLVEMWVRRLASHAHLVMGIVVVLGITLHALMDGVALALADTGDTAHGLPWAVVLHRAPVGLILWWLVRPRFGVPAAVGVLGLIAIATFAGYVAGGAVSAGMESRELALFQAFVAGALLHVAVHQHDSHRH